jgi:hypothetical protein
MTMNLQLYILSRDRPDFLRETIYSALAQDANGIEVELIVSDNSLTNDVQKMLFAEFPQVTNIRRIPTLSSPDHFRCVINESKAEFLVIFHDDDILLPNYLRIMTSVLIENPKASAVGCNSFVFYDKKTHPICFGHRFKRTIRFSDEIAFFMQNLCEPFGIAPFPGYMYRKEFLKPSFVDEKHGGKYSDVSFLSKLLFLGDLIWIPDALMLNRIHSLNDSGSFSILGKLSLIRYMISRGISKRFPMLFLYKYECWKIWFNEQGCQLWSFSGSWRVKVIRKFILTFYFYRMAKIFFYQSIWFRIKARILVDQRLKAPLANHTCPTRNNLSDASDL